MAAWTKALGNLALAEYVLLAGLALWQWLRSRAPGAGWAATSFTVLAVLGASGHALGWFSPAPPLWLVKGLVGLLLLIPFLLYRFAAAFRRPPTWVRWTAVVLTVGVLIGTALLQSLPFPGMPAPPGWLYFRLAVEAQWAFLVSFVGIRMWRAGARQPTAVRYRMRLLATAAAGINVQVIVGALGVATTPGFALASAMCTVVTAALFCVGLAFPATVRYWWRKHDADALRTTLADLVKASTPDDVIVGLLPHVCVLVGASRVALLDVDDNIIGSYSGATDGDATDPDDESASVELAFGRGLRLVVWTSRYMPYFGREEIRILGGLGDLLGLAMDRCELAERERVASDALAHQALHDGLTGLPNRALFLDRLANALVNVERHGISLATLFIDLDRFKLINDGIDHAAGDAVLVEVAHRLTDAMRAGDTVARFGGDEFVVVTELDGNEDAVAVADRLRLAVTAPLILGDRELTVTASIGVVVTDRYMEPSALLRDADAAMYLAKATGRDRVELFTETIRTAARERLDLQQQLTRALGGAELRLQYQPVFRLADGELVGFEALVRWLHPERGLLDPNEFVPTAEDSGLIVALDTWVLHEACRQTAEWRRAIPGAGAVPTWVNMSAAQFQRPDLVALVFDTLASAGLDPSGLGIEITESVFMSDTLQLRTGLAGLKSLGVAIAIDDFGTGFSSLNYLKRFPVDVIKIDASFVKGIGREPDTSLVTACLSLAHALGIVSVAEGVEQASHAAWLAANGCDHLQGFYASVPLGPDAAAKLLAEHARFEVPALVEAASGQ